MKRACFGKNPNEHEPRLQARQSQNNTLRVPSDKSKTNYLRMKRACFCKNTNKHENNIMRVPSNKSKTNYLWMK